MDTTELLREVTQSLIAVMVVAGAGYALVFVHNTNNEAITAALGVVLGWYFTKSVTAAANSNAGRQ